MSMKERFQGGAPAPPKNRADICCVHQQPLIGSVRYSWSSEVCFCPNPMSTSNSLKSPAPARLEPELLLLLLPRRARAARPGADA